MCLGINARRIPQQRHPPVRLRGGGADRTSGAAFAGAGEATRAPETRRGSLSGGVGVPEALAATPGGGTAASSGAASPSPAGTTAAALFCRLRTPG